MGCLEFPRWPLVLAAGLLVYFTLLLRYRHAWRLLPALLPTLCLAPWTSLSLDEFDLVLMVTLSGAIYHGIHPDSRPLAPRPVILLLSGYALLCIAALFNGLFLSRSRYKQLRQLFQPFQQFDHRKGFTRVSVGLGLVRWTLPQEQNTAAPVHTRPHVRLVYCRTGWFAGALAIC